MTVATAGVAAGFIGALWLTPFLTDVLYEVGTRDPTTFAAVPVLLTLVALAAASVAALRAVAVPPMEALRIE